jgi:hypothetical protein
MSDGVSEKPSDAISGAMTNSAMSGYQPLKKPLYDDETDEKQPLLEIDGDLYD